MVIPVEILVDDAGDEILFLLAPGLAALGLRIDDHVGEEQVALDRVIEIILERLGARFAVAAEDVDAHALADQRGGEVIGRAPHETAGQLRPSLQRLAALEHLLVTARHLPAAVHPPVGAFGLEGHQLDIFGPRLKVVERGGGAH